MTEQHNDKLENNNKENVFNKPSAEASAEVSIIIDTTLSKCMLEHSPASPVHVTALQYALVPHLCSMEQCTFHNMHPFFFIS